MPYCKPLLFIQYKLDSDGKYIDLSILLQQPVFRTMVDGNGYEAMRSLHSDWVFENTDRHCLH